MLKGLFFSGRHSNVTGRKSVQAKLDFYGAYVLENGVFDAMRKSMNISASDLEKRCRKYRVVPKGSPSTLVLPPLKNSIRVGSYTPSNKWSHGKKITNGRKSGIN